MPSDNIRAAFSDLAPDALLSEQEAAAILGLAPGTLRNARSRRRPLLDFVRLGGAIRYRVADLHAAIRRGSEIVVPKS